MSEPAPDQNLHLPSLVIKNFRGIDELTIPRLGRVTLLAGKNGVGKTTVLDAVRIYAARGRANILAGILRNREEIRRFTDEDGTGMMTTDWSALFSGRQMPNEHRIGIGPTDNGPGLTVSSVWTTRRESGMFQPSLFPEDEVLVLRIEFGGQQQRDIPVDYPMDAIRRHRVGTMVPELHTETMCETLGPGLPGNADLSRFWDEVVLTDDESLAVKALNLVLDATVEGIAVIGDPARRDAARGRRVVVKVAGQALPVPLQSLGDGAVRLFGVALALANSRDGFLLIDEAENGIHHSIQTKFWNMVLQTAQRNNVQVIATTHSWDCVVGFAKAANDLEDVEGILYRIQRNGERLRAVEYPESELANAAKHRIEVR